MTTYSRADQPTVALQSLMELSSYQLIEWAQSAKQYAKSGRVPTYVGGLASARPDWLGLRIDVGGKGHRFGETRLGFPLMSVMKPFLLFHLLEMSGEAVFDHVGIRPSDQAFNSLKQLKQDNYFPRNPMINSGALALTAMLPGADGGERCDYLRQWLNQRAGCQLTLDEKMLSTVRSLPNEQNRAIARALGEAGRLQDAAVALDAYEQMCCLSGRLSDVVALGKLLIDPMLGDSEHQRQVLALMLTCGLYEESGAMAVQVGLPMKSGVSGVLLAILPAGGVIATYSPPLNATGNSLGGLYLITQISQHLKLSLLSPKLSPHL
ncbi:MAG: glutaminase [Elainellaceae cyanobacterium]